MLETLQPQRLARVMDLLAEVGHDVSPWTEYKNGASNPAANPRYCYEWVFVEDGKDIVLNLWYEDLREEDGSIVLRENVRRDAELYAGLPKKQVWRKRAEKVDSALRTAFLNGVAIRVILCAGKRRDRMGPDLAASRVKRRDLDPVPWVVKEYDDRTGAAFLVRGAPPLRPVDQFSVGAVEDSPVERRSNTGMQFVRSAGVRAAVLARANGRCEYCSQPGFLTSNGEIFLETHHIVPLGDGGADTVANVAAVCPNHHREAHHGATRNVIRRALLKKVSAKAS